MRNNGTKVVKPVKIIKQIQGEVGNELSQQNLERLRNLKKSMFRSTLTNDELTNNTFDDHMSCQTFLQCFPNSDIDISDEHMCPYKKRYLIDQLKNAINQGQNLNISLITKALQKHQDSFEKKSEIGNLLTDDENLSVKGYEQIKTLIEKQQERQMKIQRYKNKKRNWEKIVSYKGRQKLAETRVRIKGRFISKEDYKSINKLLDTNGKAENCFDQKKNLDIEKFDQQTHLFNYAKDPKCIPKKQILSQIRDEYQFQVQQRKILKQIKKKTQIFTILRNKLQNQQQPLQDQE